MEQLDRLLFQVQKVHSDGRPDLFRPGAKKYTDEELAEIIRDDSRPIYVAVEGERVLGYAFCIYEATEGSSSRLGVRSPPAARALKRYFPLGSPPSRSVLCQYKSPAPYAPAWTVPSL